VSNNLVLEELGISSNQLTAIDISANINLKIFTGSFNSFHSLDFSNNTALESIECYFCELDTVILGDLPNVDTLLLPNNNLANLDISGLDAISFIIIRFNDLKNLDTTQNNLLEIAVIHNNNFIDLNFNTNEALHILECSNNESLGNINLNNENNLNFDTTTNSSSNFTNLPLLNTVCLDDVESDLAAFILEQVAHDVTFLENCTLGSAAERQTVIAIYPNPVKDFITIENREYRLDYRLYDTHGSLILESINNVYRYVQLDVSSLENGIYFMEIHTIDGENTIMKIIKY
jgi:hypothetical protein